MSQDLVHSFDNRSSEAPGVVYIGLRGVGNSEVQVLEPRGALRFALEPGDLAQFESNECGIRPIVLAFDKTGKNALGALGLEASHPLSAAEFFSDPLRRWTAAQGGTSPETWRGSEISALGAPLVIRTRHPVDIWVVAPIRVDAFLSGQRAGLTTLSIKRNRQGAIALPPPMGEVLEEFTVSRATAKAYRLQKGQIVQIIDVEGQQCSDFMAFRTAGLDQGLEQMIDSTVTRTFAGGAYPAPGLFDRFLDADMRPLLSLAQDTVGRHDTFALACTARGYEERGFPGHVNCSDNISAAMAPFGVRPRRAWPAINFFFNSWIDPQESRLRTDEAWSRAGDYVVLRATDDLVCVSTACPDDIDPINGWNPTDIHVRVYAPDAPIRRAVAYREREDAMPAISEDSVFHPRAGQLTRKYHHSRNLWTPAAFTATGAIGEYWACRKRVTLQDLSGLRKYDIKGPDAEKLLQTAMTRNIGKLPVHRGTYALMCDDTGAVIDDGTLFRLAPQHFRWCCGNEESARTLHALATEAKLRVRIEGFRGALPNLAFQGPRSRDVLRKMLFTARHVSKLDELKWFGMTFGRVGDREGAPFMLTRTGFTGELGYELFFDRSSALAIWDALMEAGREFGIAPMGNEALEILRIEAGLMAYGAEIAPGVDVFEAGLGFCVDLSKEHFCGRAALKRNAATPRSRLVGMLIQAQEVPRSGDRILFGERPVGVVTSATRSPLLERPIAMARVSIEYAAAGNKLNIGQLDGRMKRLEATVTSVPFVDPHRERPRS